jgi:hypothetical protein
MKRTNLWSLRQVLYFLLAMTLTVSACKKGDTGPAGEKGEKGETGDTGDKGSKGDAGTANVLYSSWLDLSFRQSTQTPGLYFTQIQEARITDDLLSTGEVKVYINVNLANDKVVTALPYTEGTYTVKPFFVNGIIELQANGNFSTGTDATSGQKYFQYRYVIIPGGAHVRSDKSINWNNYSEVKAYLGLKD